MKTLMLALSILALISCNKKEDSDDDDTIAVSELADFVGTWTKCHVVTGKGTDFINGSSSYSFELKINSDGTYTSSRFYHTDSGTCTGSENSISWYESGNVDVIRDHSSISGAKEISFEITYSYATARDLNGKTFSTDFKTAYQDFFTAPGLTATNPDCNNMNNTGGKIAMGDFKINSGVTTNTISVSGSTMSMGEPRDWSVGQISAPGSQGFNLTKQ